VYIALLVVCLQKKYGSDDFSVRTVKLPTSTDLSRCQLSDLRVCFEKSYRQFVTWGHKHNITKITVHFYGFFNIEQAMVPTVIDNWPLLSWHFW
jgi:hypothetical protein